LDLKRAIRACGDRIGSPFGDQEIKILGTSTKTAKAPSKTRSAAKRKAKNYVLEDQVGFIFRVVNQRHLSIFASTMIEGLTPTQFSPLVKLLQLGPCSQNQLGRETAMDTATIKGVIDRLKKRGLVEIVPDPDDKRRHLIKLTDKPLVRKAIKKGHVITEETLEPLNQAERKQLLRLLKKMT
jgi:DNA-binding MarR family transcriptional regulator